MKCRKTECKIIRKQLAIQLGLEPYRKELVAVLKELLAYQNEKRMIEETVNDNIQ